MRWKELVMFEILLEFLGLCTFPYQGG